MRESDEILLGADAKRQELVASLKEAQGNIAPSIDDVVSLLSEKVLPKVQEQTQAMLAESVAEANQAMANMGSSIADCRRHLERA
ncbi:hypothetical protein JCM19238_5219 [Vibrio ponticus]|nr:hypothetical protein JCM19238_5219 [Vibrio ponticus]